MWGYLDSAAARLVPFLAPLRLRFLAGLPTAYAVGCILSPLRCRAGAVLRPVPVIYPEISLRHCAACSLPLVRQRGSARNFHRSRDACWFRGAVARNGLAIADP